MVIIQVCHTTYTKVIIQIYNTTYAKVIIQIFDTTNTKVIIQVYNTTYIKINIKLHNTHLHRGNTRGCRWLNCCPPDRDDSVTGLAQSGNARWQSMRKTTSRQR